VRTGEKGCETTDRVDFTELVASVARNGLAMASISFCCTLTWAVSVIVRFRAVGRLDIGGEVSAVVRLSFVGVLDELSDRSALSPIGWDRADALDSIAPLGVFSSSGTPFSMGGSAVVTGEIRGVRSIDSGLAVRGANSLSKTLSLDTMAGPLKGPVGMVESPFGRFPAPRSCALARRSNMCCISRSPVTLACALAIPAEDVADQPMRSFMNSMDRFRTFWRLCKRSSDWCAKEKECKLSEGKRDRSSVKVGELGPGDNGAVWLCGSSIVVSEEDLVRTPRDGVLLAGEGRVGARRGLCC